METKINRKSVKYFCLKAALQDAYNINMDIRRAVPSGEISAAAMGRSEHKEGMHPEDFRCEAEKELGKLTDKEFVSVLRTFLEMRDNMINRLRLEINSARGQHDAAS